MTNDYCIQRGDGWYYKWDDERNRPDWVRAARDATCWTRKHEAQQVAALYADVVVVPRKG